jgi:hypothetical protein
MEKKVTAAQIQVQFVLPFYSNKHLIHRGEVTYSFQNPSARVRMSTPTPTKRKYNQLIVGITVWVRVETVTHKKTKKQFILCVTVGVRVRVKTVKHKKTKKQFILCVTVGVRVRAKTLPHKKQREFLRCRGSFGGQGGLSPPAEAFSPSTQQSCFRYIIFEPLTDHNFVGDRHHRQNSDFPTMGNDDSESVGLKTVTDLYKKINDHT